jgi:hypothetical protein
MSNRMTPELAEGIDSTLVVILWLGGSVALAGDIV